MKNRSDRMFAGVAIAAVVLVYAWIGVSSENASERGRKEYETRVSLERAKEAACPTNPACLDERATMASVTASGPVPSATGRWFFRGYPCSEDCSGHVAGYEWAKENDFLDYEKCETGNASFDEGCEAFVLEARIEENIE